MSSLSSRFAVIGNPIDHSLSPFIHQRFAEQMGINLSYEKIKGELQDFEQQISHFFADHGKGLNVTLPFKQQAFAIANERTTRCQHAKAANTLWMVENTLWADNTDGIGLIRDLERYIKLSGKKILLLGAGGAARGVIQPLLDNQPASLVLANRSVDKFSALEKDFPSIPCVKLTNLSGHFDLIINATSASLQGEPLQLSSECLENKPLCYDLAYKKEGQTPFISYVKGLGCEAYDGLGMLVEQAAESFYIWNQVRPLTEPVLAELRK